MTVILAAIGLVVIGGLTIFVACWLIWLIFFSKEAPGQTDWLTDSMKQAMLDRYKEGT